MNNQISSIQVLGTGCAKCKQLFETTKQAVADLHLDIEVEYLNDIEKIMALGVMSSPVLAINDQAVLVGQVPDVEKIKEIISAKTIVIKKSDSACCSGKDTCDVKCKPDENKRTNNSCCGNH